MTDIFSQLGLYRFRPRVYMWNNTGVFQMFLIKYVLTDTNNTTFVLHTSTLIYKQWLRLPLRHSNQYMVGDLVTDIHEDLYLPLWSMCMDGGCKNTANSIICLVLSLWGIEGVTPGLRVEVVQEEEEGWCRQSQTLPRRGSLLMTCAALRLGPEELDRKL